MVGLFLIVEEFLDDERKENTPGLNMSCLMLTECTYGFNISLRDIKIYAIEAGFKDVENLKNKINSNAAICYK